jgi:peptidyl-prolyl cis-trans isomerase C
MKALCVFALLGASFALAQTTPLPADWKDDTVIARSEDGIPLTAGDFKGLLQLHPSWQSKPWQEVAHAYFLLRRAAKEAQDKKLNEKSPYKEALDFDIMYNMANFLVQDATAAITVEPAEVEKYYNEHKEMYRQVKVSAIKVAVTSGQPPASNDAGANASRPVKKPLTEEEAKAKAQKLVAQIRAGADFGKLVLLESDDETNKTKGGELGVWKMTDDVPPLMRETVLSLHEGEVSDPVRQGPAFYIFHADALTFVPMKEVEDSVFAAVKQEKTQRWMKEFDESTKVTFPKTDKEPPQTPSDLKK